MSKTGLTRNWRSASLQIPNASSISTSMIIAGYPIIGIQMPTVWTSASISFDVTACPGGTVYPLYDDAGFEVAIPGTACTAIANSTKLEKLASWWGFRIRSGSSVDDPDDQGAARTFVIFSQG